MSDAAAKIDAETLKHYVEHVDCTKLTPTVGRDLASALVVAQREIAELRTKHPEEGCYDALPKLRAQVTAQAERIATLERQVASGWDDAADLFLNDYRKYGGTGLDGFVVECRKRAADHARAALASPGKGGGE